MSPRGQLDLDSLVRSNTDTMISVTGSADITEGTDPDVNILLLTLDSCRFDVFQAASTPVTDRHSPTLMAHAPANFTLPSHQAFFVGVLPQVVDDIRYYNRFSRQLMALQGVGARQVATHALLKAHSKGNLLTGLADLGFQTVGAGAMDWFQQETLTYGFQEFSYTGTDADAQIRFLLDTIDPAKRFFGFINFGETHAPFQFKGKKDRCPVDVRSRIMDWPPSESGPVGRDSPAFGHQVQAVEFIDQRLADLFGGLPGNTIVVLTADHGECFGEDGYWGHGVHHAKVFEVPLAIFRLDGKNF